MENLLQSVADGSAKGIRRWYAVAHAARCSHCGNFLSRMRLTLEAVKVSRKASVDPDAVARLKEKLNALG